MNDIMEQLNKAEEEAIKEAPYLASYIKKQAEKEREKIMNNEPPLIHVKPNVDPKTIPDAGKLVSYFDRIERLEQDKNELTKEISEIFADAKGYGFNTKVMRQVLKLRKMMPADRLESEFLRDEYKKMVGIES